MKLRDEEGNEYEVHRVVEFGETVSHGMRPNDIIIRPVPAPDEVSKLVSDLVVTGAVGNAWAKLVTTHIRAMLARQTERQRADEALVDWLVGRIDGPQPCMSITLHTDNVLLIACREARRAARAALDAEAT